MRDAPRRRALDSTSARDQVRLIASVARFLEFDDLPFSEVCPHLAIDARARPPTQHEAGEGGGALFPSALKQRL
jgi:hypothetical protein